MDYPRVVHKKKKEHVARGVRETVLLHACSAPAAVGDGAPPAPSPDDLQRCRGGLSLKARRFGVSLNSRLESNKAEDVDTSGARRVRGRPARTPAPPP